MGGTLLRQGAVLMGMTGKNATGSSRHSADCLTTTASASRASRESTRRRLEATRVELSDDQIEYWWEDALPAELYLDEPVAYCCSYAGLRLTDNRAFTAPDLWLRLPERDYWNA